MAYSTIPKGSLYMNPKIYTGTGSSNAITGVGFQPDWTWIKRRNGTNGHNLYDVIRGVTKTINSATTAAESTSGSGLTAFGTDGFTVVSDGDVNGSGGTYASWNWLANGAGSANTAGSINSTVSANTTSGFSIVSYTGNGGSTPKTVGHGLGVAPKMIIIKPRNLTYDWMTYNENVGATKGMCLNTTQAPFTSSNFNDTAPTTSVFSVKNNATNETNGTYIAYCFADVQGFSKMGSYTGNANANGPFVYTGFKPSFVIIKRTNLANDWLTQDNKRYPINETVAKTLKPNSALAEGDTGNLDILSNGFKLRSTGTNTNASGGTYIYMAFAENPFVATSGTSAIPVTAR